MGGSIQLASTYGEGTTMTFHIPLKKASFENTSMAPSLASLPVINQQKSCRRAQDVRVLLAEGERKVIVFQRSQLTCHSCRQRVDSGDHHTPAQEDERARLTSPAPEGLC